MRQIRVIFCNKILGVGSAGILCWEMLRIFRDLWFWEWKGGRFCKADSFVVTDRILIKGWVVFPLCLLFFYTTLENEPLQTVIRLRGRWGVFLYRVGAVGLLALYSAGIQTVGVLCANLLLDRPVFNWDQPYSVFRVYGGGKIAEGSLSYAKVAACFFLSSAGGIMLLGIVYLFLHSLFRSSKAALICALSGIILRIGMQGYFHNSGIWYTQWRHYNSRLLMLEIAFGFFLACCSYGMIRKKDFL